MPDKLSIVIPAYEEERYIEALLRKVLAVDLSRFPLDREVIVVDDGSTDRTAEIAGRVEGVIVKRQAVNQGKGSAVRAGIGLASGDLVMIQDADLEYEPDDYIPMVSVLLSSGVDAVYGSRYMGQPGRGGLANFLSGRHPGQSWSAYAGGRSLSLVARLFTGTYLTDTVTALKLFRAEVIKPLPLVTSGFELDHEITARLLAARKTIHEVPIRYMPRSKAAGKKIGLRDWIVGSRTFWRFRRG